MEPINLPETSVRKRLYTIIFEADTKLGKAFDVLLILAILFSVLVVMLDSVESVQSKHGELLFWAEWTLTAVFTVEYLLRLSCVASPRKYAFSFFGIIDLLAIIPTFLALFISGAQYFLVIRILRILRIFRVLKLVTYVQESNALSRALWASRRKIIVFLFAVFTIVVLLGSVMYFVEGPHNEQFSNIPEGVYWAVVTLTTVGYGDIAPVTSLGRALATLVMVMGYGVIAVPTGIVTGEMINQGFSPGKPCSRCHAHRNPISWKFCCECGGKRDIPF